MSKMQNRL